MPTKSSSPGPNSASQAAPRQPRKKVAGIDKEVEARAGSAGGIVLSKEQTKPSTSTAMSAAPAPKAAASADASTATASGPNRQRRRPRKLNRDEVPPSTSTQPTGNATVNKALATASTTELEALKSRVRGLEAKVEELYVSGAARGSKSPRRRGKGRKTSAQQAPPVISEPTIHEDEDEEEEADEELTRLEDELEVARQDLATYRPGTRPRSKRSASHDSEYIEEIPRGEAGVDDMMSTGDRQITLSGSYRIPLPSSVNMDDVKNIQSGVNAAQNVASRFMEQRRAQRATQNTNQPSGKSAAKRAPSTAVVKESDEKQSWGEWFGGYSVAISRAVKNIEAEAALESQRAGATPKRPAQARTASAPATKSTAVAKPAKTAPGKAAQRPALKPRATNISNEQVQGLMG